MSTTNYNQLINSFIVELLERFLEELEWAEEERELIAYADARMAEIEAEEAWAEEERELIAYADARMAEIEAEEKEEEEELVAYANILEAKQAIEADIAALGAPSGSN